MPALHAPFVLLACAGAALAANPAATGGKTISAPKDQGYEDVSPLQTSLRVVPDSPLVDDDFGRVYELEGSGGMLVRRQGAIWAVFPRSDYVSTPHGTAATIPPNTVFHIGEPASPMEHASAPSQPRPNRIAPRSRTRPVPASLATRAVEPTPAWLTDMAAGKQLAQETEEPASGEPPRVVLSDALYREKRLAQIARGIDGTSASNTAETGVMSRRSKRR